MEDGSMRILVCGSRGWVDVEAIDRRLAEIALTTRPWSEPPTVVHGAARGADAIAAQCAVTRGFRVEAHPANWAGLGKRAGYIRNGQMLDSGVDVVIAFQVAGSRGTQHTIDEARRRGIPVEVHSA